MRTLINVLAVAVLLGLYGCGGKAPDAHEEHEGHEAATEAGSPGLRVSEEAQRAGGIKTVTVKRSSLSETFQAMGRILQDAQKQHHLAAGASGRLEALSAALGDAVEPGAVMAAIKTQSGEAVTPTAPHKGIITAVHAAEGDTVNEMTFLFTITDIDPLWGVLDIPERSLALVRAGQKVEIRTAAYPGKIFNAVIAFVSPEIDSVSRMVKARISIENPGGLLKFGMFLDAAVHTGTRLRGVTLRSDSVQNGPAGPFVFVKTGGSAFEPRPVEAGGEKDGFTEIIKGVEPGEKVVAEGAFLLKSEMMKSQLGEDSH